MSISVRNCRPDGRSPSSDPPYPVYGGIFREKAIMLLRRFYIQENEKGEVIARSTFEA